jgi:hypothetical protein
VQRGLAVKVEQPGSVSAKDPELRAALDRQKAR